MRKIAIIILLNALFCASLFCKDIGESIKNDASSLWSLPHDKFKTAFGPSELYKWQAFNKTLSYNFASGKAKLYFLGQQIYKASFKFPAKRVNGMYLTFSKAPAKTDKGTYLKTIKELQDNINSLDKFPPPKLNKRKSGKWYRSTCSWKSSRYSISLKWVYSRATKAPFKSKNTKLSVFYRGTQIIAKKETSETDIQNAGNGDFCLNVPMIVEKSPKNSLSTCVSRVMEYYVEKVAKDSEDEKQTNKNIYKFSNPANIRYDIEDMLKKSFSIQEVISPECFEDYMKFSSLIYTYNSYAGNKLNSQYNKIIESKKKIKDSNYVLMKTINKKSEKRASINVDSSGKRILNQSYKLTRYYVYLTNMIEIILKMNEEDAWIKTQCKRKSTVKKFKKRICKKITQGKPVIWDVILGIVKEKNAPSVRGKYVRLIVGYNDKTNELIYSDSLGKGHELKKMSWDKAWAITYKTVVIMTKKKNSL